MLVLIWSAALALVALAISAMAVLIGIRVWSERRARREEAARAVLLERLLAWLDGRAADGEVTALLRAHGGAGRRLLVEIFELVRGEDQARLAALAAEAGIPEELRQRLARRDRFRRLDAAEALVWFPGPETGQALEAALRDPDDDVALAAAASLADLGEPLPVATLLHDRLGRGGDSSRRLEAVLARVASRQADDLMGIVADEAGPVRVRAAAIDALARTGRFDLGERIAEFAENQPYEIRAAVARSLGVLGHPGGAGTITRLLGDADWEVRAEAAEAAGRIGLLEATDRLTRSLDDPNWWVRFRAGEALATLGEPGVAALRAVAAVAGDVPRRMASLVLAERGLAP